MQHQFTRVSERLYQPKPMPFPSMKPSVTLPASFFVLVCTTAIAFAAPAESPGDTPRVEQLSALIAREPRNGWHYRDRAYAFALLGDEVRMQADIDKALALLPNDNGLYNSLGWSYINIGRPKLASHYWQEALRISEGKGRSDFYCSALGYWATGEILKAARAYDEAVRRDEEFGQQETLSERTKDWTQVERQLVQGVFDAWRKGYRAKKS